ncbi:A/G-specific adenine glycosylase [Natrialbaceae archaeon A-CW1-1]
MSPREGGDEPDGENEPTDRGGGDGNGDSDTARESAPLPTGDDLEAIQSALIEWYEDDHREYPWRQTDDPYAILVSEVMSQQTQLDRVVDAWEAFLERWPTTAALADADRADVVGFWSSHSLGYNNRAKYLHEAARQIETEFDGTFPETPEALQSLMGVGPYTANAVASFAFNNGDAVVDTNVKRVCFRAFSVPDDDDQFATAANHLLPEDRSRVWNNAVMELGAVACGKQPRCEATGCPWRQWCRAYATGDFSAPDVPTQSTFEGSRRQFRGRVIRTLESYDELALDELGPRIRVDYTPDGDHGREWLEGLLEDLETDGLVELETRSRGIHADPEEDRGSSSDDANESERVVRLKR